MRNRKRIVKKVVKPVTIKVNNYNKKHIQFEETNDESTKTDRTFNGNTTKPRSPFRQGEW